MGRLFADEADHGDWPKGAMHDWGNRRKGQTVDVGNLAGNIAISGFISPPLLAVECDRYESLMGDESDLERQLGWTVGRCLSL